MTSLTPPEQNNIPEDKNENEEETQELQTSVDPLLIDPEVIITQNTYHI